MILTDRAREDFLKHHFVTYEKEIKIIFEVEIGNQKICHTYSDIIEWFDSVGIYIYICKIGGFISYHIETENIDIKSKVGNRQEATKQAIIKANEIYNEKHK